MKQGTLINRIVMLLLLAAVLVYLGVSAWRSFRDPYTLVLSYAYTVDDSLEATGFLVREERVLASPGGIVDLLPEEGEKVSRGETVALLYQNDSGLARKEELQSLTMEKEQLQYALERTQSGGDSSQLSQQVIDAIVALRSSVSTGDLTQLLKSLVYKRDFTFNGGEEDGDAAAAIQSSIDAVDAQIAALSAQAAQDTSRLTASQAGVFSGQTDGYESLLTPALLETITPGQLSQLDRQRPQPDAGAVGKLVTDATWYFVCAMGEEEAGRLIEGRTVTVRFSRDWSGEVDMKVERVGETPENSRVTVVLSSDRYLSETTLLRKQTVELVFDSQTGIRVPTQAVRVEERTVTDPETEEEKQELVTGVYVLVGQQAEFKPVTILAQLEDFALVKSADGSDGKTALRAGDEVILSSVELFDGKVITQS